MTHAARSRLCVIGLDLGTSSCKASLVDDAGRLVASSAHDYLTHTPQPGWTEQSPADWLSAASTAVRELWNTPAAADCHVQAIGLTCAAHIGVLLDESDNVLRRAILWSDLRAAPQAAMLNKQAGDRILELSGQIASSGWTLAQMQWVREHEPAIHARLRSLLLSKDYLAWKLTGVKVTDRATAVSSQFYDVTTDRWSDELLAMAGMHINMLPAVMTAESIVGTLLPEWADALGLPAGVVVVTGSLDTATEMLAAGCTQPGQGMIRLATAGGLQVVTPGLMRHRQRITYPHVDGPCWYVQSGTSTCAAAIAWGKKQFAPEASWEQIEKSASAVPAGCDGLIFHPYLQGERSPYWNPHLKAQYTGLSQLHHTSHLLRAIFEGTAMSIADAMRVMADLPLADVPLSVVGGGSRSRLWVKILASVLNRPLRPLPKADSALGAALLAWRSAGHMVSSSLEVPHELLTLPDPSWVEVYLPLLAEYQAIAHHMIVATQSRTLTT